jgi:putative SbcD/Mre11-related phosphoesterase
LIEFTGSEAIIFKRKYLVISDLHIGIEKEYLLKGINIPPQTEKLIEKIITIRDEFRADRLIILGDFKHNIPRTSKIEEREIPKALELLSSEFSKIYITKGNHDGNLESFVTSKKIRVLKALKIGSCVFTHGHARTNLSGSLYVIGHHHFALRIQTSIGEPIYEKVFVLGNTKYYSVLILPAFSDLVGFWDVNSFHGPIAKKIKSFSVLSLDGTILLENKLE